MLQSRAGLTAKALAKRLPQPLREIVARLVSTGQRASRSWKWPGSRQARKLRDAILLRKLSTRKEPVALFFSHEAGLEPFLASYAILAKTRVQFGRASIMLSCDGFLPICTVKNSMGMKPTRSGDAGNPACQICRKAAASRFSEYGLASIKIESLLGLPEREKIKKIIEENLGDLSGVNYGGVKIGALAVGETLRLVRKSNPAEFTAEDREMVKALAYSSLAICLVLEKIGSRFSTERIVYFGDYAFFIAAEIIAKRDGIAVTRITHLYNRDVDRRMISLQQTCASVALLDQIDGWREYRDDPIERSAVSAIAEGALYRLRGHGGASTHSPNWTKQTADLEEKLGLSRSRKTLVAYTSSLDEFVAARGILEALGRPYATGPRPFDDQFTWLRALVDWTESRSDVQLIVRVHPRTGTSRFPTAASEYYRLKSEFAVCPSNVIIVWPDDPVSSYNLAEIADAVLVSWSTIGLECARFGIPVIAAFSKIGSFPTGGFISFEETPQRYFARLEKALDAPASLANITEAYRWTHYAFWAPVVDVSDVIPAWDYPGVPPWRIPANSETILRVLNHNEDLASINMQRLRKTSTDRSELQGVIEAVARTAAFFMTGEDRLDAHLESFVPQKIKGTVTAHINGQLLERYSPLLYRLAKMRKLVSPREHANSPAEL
jgi:hypothetical protein